MHVRQDHRVHYAKVHRRSVRIGETMSIAGEQRRLSTQQRSLNLPTTSAATIKIHFTMLID
jgi:hypothetical protein